MTHLIVDLDDSQAVPVPPIDKDHDPFKDPFEEEKQSTGQKSVRISEVDVTQIDLDTSGDQSDTPQFEPNKVDVKKVRQIESRTEANGPSQFNTLGKWHGCIKGTNIFCIDYRNDNKIEDELDSAEKPDLNCEPVLPQQDLN